MDTRAEHAELALVDKLIASSSPIMTQPDIASLFDPPYRLLTVVSTVIEDPRWLALLGKALAVLPACKKALDESEDLRACLETCTAEGKWAALFALLKKEYPQKTNLNIQVKADREPEVGWQRKATENAWRTKFVGSSHELLLSRLNKIARNSTAEGLYTNVLPMVQSSGMGKSRTVDEMAKLAYTIPICLRAEDENGYPDGDKSIVSIFNQKLVNKYSSEAHFRTTWIAIFTVIFQAISKELLRCPVASPLEWYDRLKENSTTIGIETMTIREEIYATVNRNWIHIFNKGQREAINIMKNALRGLLEQLPAQPNSSVKIVVYVDECQRLLSFKLENDPNRRTMLDSLAYAINQCRTESNFVCLVGIFLSTNSIVRYPSSPKEVVSSSREVDLGFNVRPAPFVHLNFDFWKHNEPIISESTMTLSDVCKTSFLARLGRPLWWTRITNSESGQISNELTLVRFAAIKLTNSLPKPLSENRNAKIAILGVRLCLELESSRQTSKILEEDLVASHMRIAYHIPDHKEYMRSGYSSEPILAEAAARLWNNKLTGFSPCKPLQVLENIAESGFLNKGDRGELVARYIFLCAQDIAVMRQSENNNNAYGFSRAVPLVDFLKALFNSDVWEGLTTKKARNREKGQNLETACKNKYVRFNHFARAGDSSVLSTAAGWKALARGNGWQCFDRQKAINIIIPVFSGEYSAKLSRATVTFIVIQVKNTKDAKTVHFSAESLGLFNDLPPKDKRRKIPYFVMVFNLGVSRPAPAMMPTVSSPLATATTRQSDENSAEDDPDASGHPCYWIEVQGCSSNVFNEEIIPMGSKVLRAILGTHSLMEEADDQQTQDAIQRLKPNFVAGDASFGWAKDDTEGNPGTAEYDSTGLVEGVQVLEDDPKFTQATSD